MDEFTRPHSSIEADQHKAWIERLPTIVNDLIERWSIDEIDDPYQAGQAAWVAPVRIGSDDKLVLKVGWKHPEAAHEVAGLTEWDGRGAVLLHEGAELEDSVALLIERCLPGTNLAAEPESQQDMVIAGLLQRLWLSPQPPHVFRPLQLMCDQWADEFECTVAAEPGTLDPGLAREGIALFRHLPSTAQDEVLLCTDLHAQNVLAAEREPWLVIDPKPYVGDPTYDPLQHMLNCEERLKTDPHGLALRMANLLGLDGERLLLWLFARCVQESPDSPALAEIARRIAPR